MAEDTEFEMDDAFTRDSFKGATSEPAYAGALSFLRRRYTKDLSGVGH